MNIPLNDDEARVWLGFIDITLKSRGIEALDAAFTFKMKIVQAQKAEQDEKLNLPARNGADGIVPDIAQRSVDFPRSVPPTSVVSG